MLPIITAEDAAEAKPAQWYRADDNRLWLRLDPGTRLPWIEIVTSRPSQPGNNVDWEWYSDERASKAGLVPMVPDATVVPPRPAFSPREELASKPDLRAMHFVPNLDRDTREVRVVAEDGDRRVEIVIEDSTNVAELEKAVSLATQHVITLVAAVSGMGKDVTA